MKLNSPHIAVTILLYYIFLAVFTGDTSAQMTFGARTQIWYFMWKGGSSLQSDLLADKRTKWSVAESNLDIYSYLGSTWNIVDVWQQVDGPDGFKRLKRVIEEHERRGIQVALRLLENPEVYERLKTDDDSINVLSDYVKWVSNIAKCFGKNVRYFLISNEADHDIGYNDTLYRSPIYIQYNDYEKILATAYKAIKAVDKELLVLDHGTSSYSLCLAVASNYVQAGRIDRAMAFLRGMRNSGTSGWTDTAKAVYALRRLDSMRRIEFAKTTVRRAGHYSDALQLHHYFGPEVLPQLIQWIKDEMASSGSGRPIVATEIGYRIPSKMGKTWDGRTANVADMSQYSEQEHAADIVKDVAILGALGIQDVLYWHVRFQNNRSPTATLYVSTVEAGSFIPLKAAKAWSFAARQFSNIHEIFQVKHKDNRLVEYKVNSNNEFSVLWTMGGSSPLPKDWRPHIRGILDIEGREIPLESQSALEVSESPWYIVWYPPRFTQ